MGSGDSSSDNVRGSTEVRRASMTPVYRAVVVGAGPAGVAAAGTLVDDSSTAPLLWVDPAFAGGRLVRYRSVASNTKVRLFVSYGEACKCFGGAGNDAVATLRTLNPQETCELSRAHDLTSALAARVRQVPYVHSVQGTVSRVEKVGHLWHVTVDASAAAADGTAEGGAGGDTRTFRAERVLLATGSHPRGGNAGSAHGTAPHIASAERTGAPPAVELSLDVGLDQAALREAVTAGDTVAVVGTSHSAVLVLRSLCELLRSSGKRPARIINFFRKPLLYAEPRADEHGRWIFRDNTGLKGEAAAWARKYLEHPSRVPELQRVSTRTHQEQAYDAVLPVCTKIIYAIGYERNTLPTVVVDGEVVAPNSITHNPATGQLLSTATDQPLTGLYGFGIAFPELWTDPLGNKEYSVGMIKFMRYLKRAVPEACPTAKL